MQQSVQKYQPTERSMRLHFTQLSRAAVTNRSIAIDLSISKAFLVDGKSLVFIYNFLFVSCCFYIFWVSRQAFITATFREFGTHPVDREPFIMFNIGGPITGGSSFSSLVGIGSSIQLEGLEGMTIFMNVSRDTRFKNFSASYDPRSWQFCAD